MLFLCLCVKRHTWWLHGGEGDRASQLTPHGWQETKRKEGVEIKYSSRVCWLALSS